MNNAEKKLYAEIIAEFEQSYQSDSAANGIPDTPMSRAGFYGACLRVLEAGPLHSPHLQVALVKYYREKRDQAYKKVAESLNLD